MDGLHGFLEHIGSKMVIKQLHDRRNPQQFLEHLASPRHGRIRHRSLDHITAVFLFAQLDETPAQPAHHLREHLFPPSIPRGAGEEMLHDVVSHGMAGKCGSVGGELQRERASPRGIEDVEGES